MEILYLTGYSSAMNTFAHSAWGGAVGFGALGAALGTGFAIILIVLVLWELVWKGLALWHSAKNGQIYWFVAFLLVHTLGILEIIYLFGFRTDRRANPLFGKKTSSTTSSSPM